VFNRPNQNFLAFNRNSDELKSAEAVISRGRAARTNPHLSRFPRRGAWLIFFRSWSDPAITSLAS
jgi:hypothetical protein